MCAEKRQGHTESRWNRGPSAGVASKPASVTIWSKPAIGVATDFIRPFAQKAPIQLLAPKTCLK